jgi:RIO-like serine/threonine protein kinase
MYPLVKGISKNKKKYLDKLSFFSLSHMLGMPKETVRRKVDALCKAKLLEYSVTEGVTVGDNFEVLAKKIGPLDLLSINKAIKAIEKNGGVSKILKKI